MKQSKLTRAQEQSLRDQVITADQPGPVLRDFRVLLEFLGPEGVEAGGKYNLLPLKFIGELDRRLSRPLHLELKRPQLRSHPYLQGLNLLLRASGLSRVEGSGAKARLVLDPAMRMQWDRLNPTEQYFHLMEAWLRFGRAEMVGERGSVWGDLLPACLQVWKLLPKNGLRFDAEKPREVYLPGVGRDFYLLALMDLFGLLEVEQPPHPVTPWSPAGVKHVPFGDAVFTLLADVPFGFLLGDDLPQAEDEDRRQGRRRGRGSGPGSPCSSRISRNGGRTWSSRSRSLGRARSSSGCRWARSGGSSPCRPTPRWTTWSAWILRSVDFDSDHLYEFTYRDRLGAKASASHAAMDEGPWADQIPVGTLPLEPGQTMQLLYDFGDNWQFTVKLERIEPPGARAKGPRILESHGKAPSQYQDWEE